MLYLAAVLVENLEPFDAFKGFFNLTHSWHFLHFL